ncbi:MAG: hypothetical protein AABW82_02020 [Nanoarchaeota archaeon]
MDYKIFHFTKEGEVFKILDSIKPLPNKPLRSLVFLYDNRKPLYELLEKLKPIDIEGINFLTEYENDEVKLLKIILENHDEKVKDKIKNYLLIAKNAPFVVLITNIDKDGFNKILSLLNRYSPILSRIYLRSFEIKEILEKIENEDKAEIAVKSYVLKRYYVKKKIDLAWENITYKELFNKANENFLWVDGIQLSISERGNSGSVRINRKGIIQYGSLLYSTIEKLFLEKIISKYSKFYEDILKERSRNLTSLEPKPIKFVMDEEVFRQPEDIDQFINSIHKTLNNWGYSILFKEGIHLFMLIHDYNAGSSYELLITSSSEIIVIPQTQVTSLSFNGLVNFLMRNYDGEVIDGKQS